MEDQKNASVSMLLCNGYKGYRTTISYDEDDGFYYGHIDGIKSMFCYDGATIEEFVDAFKEAVDDYIDWLDSRQTKRNN